MNIDNLRDALAGQAEEARSDAVIDRLAKVHSRVRRVRRRRQVGGTSIAVAAVALSAVLVPQLVGGPAPTSPGDAVPAASPQAMERLYDSNDPTYVLDQIQEESVVLDDQTRSLTFDVPASDKPRELIAGLRSDLDRSLAESDGSIEVYVDGHPVPFVVRHAVRPAPGGGLEPYRQVDFVVLEPGPHEVEVRETDDSVTGETLATHVYEVRRMQ